MRALLLTSLAALSLAACKSKEPPRQPMDFSDLTKATVELTSAPPGAAVDVDGQPTGKVTPVAIRVDTGKEHRFLFRHPDCFDLEKTAFVAPNEQVKVEAQLVAGGWIAVTGTEGAKARVVGGETFTVPGRTRPVKPGEHVVEVTAPGRATEYRTLEVGVDGPAKAEVLLAPGAAVEVETTPPGAEIALDGTKLPDVVTPATLAVSADKRHTVSVTLDGYGPRSAAVKAQPAGAQAKVTLALEPAGEIALRQTLARLQEELAGWKKKEAALERTQKAEFVDGPIQKDLARKRAYDQAVENVERLETEIATLQDELHTAVEKR